MKPLLLLLLLSASSCTMMSQNNYPSLVEKSDLEMSYDDYEKYSKKDYYREYLYNYVPTISKNTRADIGAPNEADLPWNLIQNNNPKPFFESATSTIAFSALENDKYMFSITMPLTQSEKDEQKKQEVF